MPYALHMPHRRVRMPHVRVSGSSGTKTYGKDTAVREREEKQTLPRRSIFGKDIDERPRFFKELKVLVSPTEALFSGKLSCTAIAERCRALP
jgi:hypothetical protein